MVVATGEFRTPLCVLREEIGQTVGGKGYDGFIP